MKKQTTPRVPTWMVQCQFGKIWKDYYVQAPTLEEAKEEAVRLFRAEFRIASRFIRASG